MKTANNIYGIAPVLMRSLALAVKAQYLHAANDYKSIIGEYVLNCSPINATLVLGLSNPYGSFSWSLLL